MCPRKQARSLNYRLLLILALVLVPLVALHAGLLLHFTREQWMGTLSESAQRGSELVKRAIHYGMLLERKEGVQHTVEQLATGPGVADITIYDKGGRIAFSADPRDIGKQVDMQAQACIICHSSTEPLDTPPVSERTRRFRSPSGELVVGLITPLENRAECASAGCHVSPEEVSVLGVLDIQLSALWVEDAISDERIYILVGAGILAVVASVVLLLANHRALVRPLRRLVDATQQVAAGDLTLHLSGFRQDEIGGLARAFNAMTRDLHTAQMKVRDWSEHLERKVVQKTEELGKIQEQVAHIEKMASLGKLSATVAHELNNPLSGILTYAKLVSRDIDRSELPEEQREELVRYLSLVQRESARCGRIVQNLLLFARQSSSQMLEAHLREIIDRSVMLIRHHVELRHVELEVTLDIDDDSLRCDPDQLQQALVALLMNAIEAMPHGGSLAIVGADGDDGLTVEVRDTGVGMPPEIQAHVFEPFFSTKEEQSGVGLGLAVVYGIVQRHSGQIQVDSSVGKGTTFRLKLPRRPEQPQDAVAVSGVKALAG